jgi:uncharacterized damage-inducible protein DinB
MNAIESLLNQYDVEAQNTRKILECVPPEKFGWKPHEKSCSLAGLAGHIAELPGFLSAIATTDVMELTAGEWKPFIPSTREELMQGFEKTMQDTRKVLAGLNEAEFAKPWKLTFKGAPVMDGPRSTLLPNTLHHLVHHRGQLTVYLRLLGVKFPGVYGPSADEMAQFG